MIAIWKSKSSCLYLRTDELMEMLGLKESVVQIAKANGVKWYSMCWGGMMGMFWEKHGSLKWMAKGSEESKRVGLEKEDAMNQVRWRVGVGEIAVRMG